MINDFIEAIRDRLPLLVERVEWSDPILSIGGRSWMFNSTSMWRIVDDQRLIAGAEDDKAGDSIRKLLGNEMILCEAFSQSPKLDPRFVFSNGMKLEVFSATAIEPWTFSFLDGPVFVASPSA